MSLRNILIVEDDPTHLHLWKRLMANRKPEEIFMAESSEEAEKIIAAQKIDFLISDIMLPKMNGYELAKRARLKNGKIQILLTTAYGADLSRFDIGKLKCHLLHKPYHNIDEVMRLVDRILNGKNPAVGADEESFTDNMDHPEVTEWSL